MHGALVVMVLRSLQIGLADSYFAQYAKFRTVQTRDAAADSVALMEIYLMDPDQNQVDLSSAVATNPGGNHYSGQHPPSLAIDKTWSKWLDFNKGDLIVSLPPPSTAIGYFGMQLAEDAPQRDPVLFELLLSQDSVNWVLVYKNSNTAVVPNIRNHDILNLELAAQWRDFLFEPISTRNLTDEEGPVIQVAEFQLWDAASPPAEIDLPAQGATATDWQNLGNSPSGEGPDNAVDGDVATKWLDFNMSRSAGLHIQLPNPVSLSSWSWVTANDYVNRDPFQWNFYGLYIESGNNNMVLLNQQSTDLSVPLERKVSVGVLTIAPVLTTSTTTSSVSTSSTTATTTSTYSSSTSTSMSSTTSTSASTTATSTSSTTTASKSTSATSSTSKSMSSTSSSTSMTTSSATSTSTYSSRTSTSTSSTSITKTSTTSLSSSTTSSSISLTRTTVTVTSGDAAVLSALVAELIRDLESSQESMAQLFRVLDSSSNTSTPEVYGTLVTLPNIHAGTPFYTRLLRAGPNETSAGSMQVFAGESVVDIPTALFTSEARPGYAVISITNSQPGDEISAILAAYTQASGDVLVTQPISIKAGLLEHGVNGTLPAPLNFTMPITDANATGDLTCVYWDEQQDAWSSQGVMTVSAAGGSVRCSTTHLSLFAAIIRAVVTTLVCSNAAAIFSLEGLQSLLKWQWAVQAPAIIQWVTLLAGLCLVFAAKRMDQRYMEHVDALEGFQEIRILRPVEFSRREFVTDLREYFLGVFHPSRRVASQLVKRKIGLGVGELYRLQRVSGVTAWHKQARSILSKFSEQRLLLKLTMLYQVHCRWFSFATPSLKASCAQRCSVLLAKLYSGWAIMAVFYGSTALAPDQPECAPPEALLDKLVRSAVIAWISAIFGSVPFVVLLALVHFGGNSASSARTNLFWGYMTIHLILCALVVSIFLASVSPADGEKFLLSTVTNLLTSLLVTPVLLTVLFGACMLARADDLDRLLEWQQEDQFEVSVSKVVVPVEQLQATMKLDLRLNVTVLAEVFGDHSSSTTLDRNKVSGSFSSSDTFLVTKRQVLMFTVVVVELQRRHAFTLHAVALGSDALAGYSGALPLFVPGKKSPCAEVLVEVAPAGGKEEKVDAKGQDEEVLIVQVAPNNEGTPLEEKVDNKSPDEEGVTVPVVALEPEPPCEAPTPATPVARTPETREPLSGSKNMLHLQQEFALAPLSRPRMGPCLRPQSRTLGTPRRAQDPTGASAVSKGDRA